MESQNICPHSFLYEFWDYCLGAWSEDDMEERFGFIVDPEWNTSWAEIFKPMREFGPAICLH